MSATPTSTDEEVLTQDLTNFELDDDTGATALLLCDSRQAEKPVPSRAWRAVWEEGESAVFPAVNLTHVRLEFDSDAAASEYVRVLRSVAESCRDALVEQAPEFSEIYEIPIEDIPEHLGLHVSAGPGVSSDESTVVAAASLGPMGSVLEASTFWADGRHVSMITVFASPGLFDMAPGNEGANSLAEFTEKTPDMLRRTGRLVAAAMAQQPPVLPTPSE